MNGLVDAIHLCLSVRYTAQTRARQQSQASRDDARLVADDVAKEIARHNDTVERPRVLDHQHGRAVNEVMANLQLRELLGKHLRHDLAPQPRGRHDVRLVQAPHLLRRTRLQGQVSREAGDALNLRARIRLGVEGEAGPVILGALAKVDAAGQLADDGEVDALAHGLFERRGGDQRGRGEEAGPQIAKRGHLLAELEETLFRSDGAGAPFLRSPSAQECRASREERGRTGPPMAPRRTASALLAAARASSVSGFPWASMEAWLGVKSTLQLEPEGRSTSIPRQEAVH